MTIRIDPYPHSADNFGQISEFSGRTVLILGDLMLDRYVAGRVDRLSPEAPIPVLRVISNRCVVGGAGNVAANVAALGGRAILCGIVGRDSGADELRDALHLLAADAGSVEPRLIEDSGRPTTVKTRFIADRHQLLRSDEEVTSPLAPEIAEHLLAAFNDALPEADVVVLSDYAKGVLCDAVLVAVLAAAGAAGKTIIADPKSIDLGRYRGAGIVTPNSRELSQSTGLDAQDDALAAAAAARAVELTGGAAIVFTRGEKGMLVARAAQEDIVLPAVAREVADVSGAGDTVVAVLALGLAGGMEIGAAARLANLAAGLSVGKLGTATVSQRELTQALQLASHFEADAKILTRADAAQKVAHWRRQGLKVGFTNGCFDLIHPGHVRLLAKARRVCDRLVVALNTDASVQRLKGPTRPVQNETARSTVMASLAAVDLVTLFGEDTPLELIEALRPDYLIKGADYTIETVVGAGFVQSYGGEVVLVELEEGHSTTGTIRRMRADGVSDK